jgi:GMP synthase-like glutamine amidotransferase
MLNHRGYRDAGFLVAALVAHGLSVRWFPREDLPGTSVDLRHTDVVVSLGSLHDPVRDLRVDYVRREIELLREARRQGRYVVGVCFGAQLLAGLAGGRVHRLPAATVGYRRVVFEPADLTSTEHFFWNAFGFTAPHGARVIASGPASCWAYVHDRTLAVQFHVDASASLLDRWTRESGAEFEEFGLDRCTLLSAARRHDPGVARSCGELVSALLAGW